MLPRITCHMLSPVDGRVDTRGWSPSPDASQSEIEQLYFQLLQDFGARGCITGRASMAEFADGEVRTAQPGDHAVRPYWRAGQAQRPLVVVLDPSARLHWRDGLFDDSHLLMVLGSGVSDGHLCELAERGVSYLIAPQAQIDPRWLLQALVDVFGGDHYLLTGGGITNGHFLKAGVVDQLSLLIAPSIDGISGGHSVFEGGSEGLGGHVRLHLTEVKPLGSGVVQLCYEVSTAAA